MRKELEKLINAMPVNSVEWIHRDNLEPNNYNPNRVAPPEHDLLEISILEDGWTQPIVKRWDEEIGKWIIVDGENRWFISKRPKVYSVTGGYVPTVTLNIKSEEHPMMSTIRHNRARGTHVVLDMAEIVQDFIEKGLTKEEIMHRLQMEEEEVIRLANRTGVPLTNQVVDEGFGQAWKPD